MLERFKNNPTVRAVLALSWKGRGVLLCRLVRDRRVPFLARLILPLLVLYLLMPIDIIPDFIPVVGYLDDALVIMLAAWAFTKLTDPDLVIDMATELAEQYPGKDDDDDD